ncbi:uncharacterized protein [Panulirus ornatus]
MLLLLPLVALAALAVQSAPTTDEGRDLGWLRDLTLGQHPDVNPAGMEPEEELHEEGRRRSDKVKSRKKKPSKVLKDQQDSAHIAASGNFEVKLPGDKGDLTGHNAPILAVPEKPLIQVPILAIQKPETVEVPVSIPTSPSVWSWIKGILPTWSWSPSSLSVATPQISHSNLKPQVSQSSPTQHLSTLKPQATLTKPVPQFTLFKPQVSLSNLLPQFSAFIPTQAPIVEEPIQVPPAHQPVSSPTTSEVMVLRYPEFIKHIGRGISKVSNAVKTFGLEMSQSLANQFNLHSIPTKLGAGVAALIPLKDESDTQQHHGTFSVPVPSIQKPVLSSGLNLGSLFNKGSGVSVSGSASGSISVSTADSHNLHKGGTHNTKTSVVVDSYV